MAHAGGARSVGDYGTHHKLVEKLIPDAELAPRSVDDVLELPSFLSKIRQCEQLLGRRYAEVDHAVQDALVLRRLQQMVHTLMLNPLWNERIRRAGLNGAPRSFEEWQQVPITDKQGMEALFMRNRPGMVVPLNRGGFQIVASGGTSSGSPVEAVYPIREFHDTYALAGEFMGNYILAEHLAGQQPKWVITTLADYQMWSSGTMVGGVLQNIPGINYIGAGPIRKELFQHILSYEGKKAFMAISRGIAIMTDLGAGLGRTERESFHVALYGSGLLPHRKRVELLEMYPNLKIMSYFAATQAETIGLQRTPDSWLADVPGLHLVEIVDEQGRWVAEGEEGELVVTRLLGHEAPFPRFKVGDRMIRRPNLDGPGLKTRQFEFAGRSGDVIHLADTQYSAPRAYESICKELYARGIMDLEALAHEFQFLNDRTRSTLTLLAAVDTVEWPAMRVASGLGEPGVRHVFLQALTRSLSLYNLGDATPESIERAGYRFELRFVTRQSPEIHRTEVGKVPIIRDIFE
jgi:phenylacetate-CoA ligase